MSSAYNCERAHRSTYLLATLPMEMRERLPVAWDEGMSMINPNLLPSDCTIAATGLQELRRELNRETDTYFARTFGSARASLRRRHNFPTLKRFAKLMLDIEADLDRHFEMKTEGNRR